MISHRCYDFIDDRYHESYPYKCKSVTSQRLEYNLRTIANGAMFRLINGLLQFWTDGEDCAALIAFFPQWNDKRADQQNAPNRLFTRR